MKVAFIDPNNSTTYYNLCLADEMSRQCPGLIFLTGDFIYDKDLKYPPNTKIFFFLISNFISESLGLSQKYRRVLRGIEYPFNLINLFFFILIKRIKIVHFNISLIPKIDVLFFTILKIIGIKVAYTAHNSVPHDSGNQYILSFKRLYYKVDRIITLTKYIKDELIGKFNVNKNNIVVIPHGNFDYIMNQYKSEFQKEKSIFKFIGFIGRDGNYKGLNNLLMNFKKVSGLIQCKLVIIGIDVNGVEKYKAIAKEFGVDKDIIWHVGYLPLKELLKVMHSIDVLVFPYIKASQSGGIPTAFTLNIPVVATNVGGLPEMIDDEKDGFIVNDIEELIDKLIMLITNNNLIDEMKDYISRERKKKDNWKIICSDLVKTYQKLL